MSKIDDAIEALLDYQQADMEGVMVLASRQAIHEVCDALRRSSERSDEAMIEAVREVCARQAERFYDNPNLEDHLKPALEVARICGKQISDSIRKLHFNDDFRASVSSHVTEKTDG